MEIGGRWLRAEAESFVGRAPWSSRQALAPLSGKGAGRGSPPAGDSAEQPLRSWLLCVAPATLGLNEKGVLQPEAGSLSPLPWAITPTPEDVPSALGHIWYWDQRGTLWYCPLRAGTATTRPHPRGVEGSGRPREGAGRMRLEGAQGTQRQWGWEVTGGGTMCEPRLQVRPLEPALLSLDFTYKTQSQR